MWLSRFVRVRGGGGWHKRQFVFAAFGGDEEKNGPFSRVFHYKKCLKTLIFAKIFTKRQIFSKIRLKCQFIDLPKKIWRRKILPGGGGCNSTFSILPGGGGLIFQRLGVEASY